MTHSPFFKIQELVPPEVFARFGNSSWWFLRPEAVQALNKLRKHLDRPITVNNWATGGMYEQSGLRTIDSQHYSAFSQHSFGNAFDIKVSGMSAESVYDWCLAHESLLISWGFTTIEDKNITPTWTHLDCRMTGNDKLMIVRP